MAQMSLDPFVLRFDRTNPGVMQSHCLICNRMIAASREMRVLEIVQRIHICKRPAPGNVEPDKFL
jgi:hypothetical protein